MILFAEVWAVLFFIYLSEWHGVYELLWKAYWPKRDQFWYQTVRLTTRHPYFISVQPSAFWGLTERCKETMCGGRKWGKMWRDVSCQSAFTTVETFNRVCSLRGHRKRHTVITAEQLCFPSIFMLHPGRVPFLLIILYLHLYLLILNSLFNNWEMIMFLWNTIN